MSVEDFSNEFRKRRLEAGISKPSRDDLKRIKKKQKVSAVGNKNTREEEFPQSNIEQKFEESKIQSEGLPLDFFQSSKSDAFKEDTNSHQTQGENINQIQYKQNKVEKQQQAVTQQLELQRQQQPPPPKQIPKNFFDPTKEDRQKQLEDLKSLEQELNTYEKEYQEEQDQIAEKIQNQRTQDEEQLEKKFEKEQRQFLKGGTVNQKLNQLKDENKYSSNKIPKRSKLMQGFVEIGGEETSSLSDDEFDDSVSWMGKTSVGFLKKKKKKS